MVISCLSILMIVMSSGLVECLDYAKVDKIIVPGQSPVYDVHFEDDKSDSRKFGHDRVPQEGRHDTSLAFSVPLFSFTMPGYRQHPDSSDLISQAAIALGSLGLLATVAYFPFYLGLDGSTTVGRSGGPMETVAGYAESFSRAFGLEDCGQMAICDAHANYRDYGILALPIILIFPGLSSNGTATSRWQEAAMLGKSRQECHNRYNCLLNPMWIAKFLMTTLIY